MNEVRAIIIGIIIWLVLGVTVLTCFFYDLIYIYPVASERANLYCQEIGYDQYKEFGRIGLFSKEPVGIKCEYVERYTDLGIRS